MHGTAALPGCYDSDNGAAPHVPLHVIPCLHDTLLLPTKSDMRLRALGAISYMPCFPHTHTFLATVPSPGFPHTRAFLAPCLGAFLASSLASSRRSARLQLASLALSVCARSHVHARNEGGYLPASLYFFFRVLLFGPLWSLFAPSCARARWKYIRNCRLHLVASQPTGPQS